MSNVWYFDEEEEVLDYTWFEDEDPGYLDLSPSMSLTDEDLLSCQDLAEPVAELSQATVEPAVAEPLPAEHVVTPEQISYFDEEEEVLDYTGFEDEDPGYLDLSSPSTSFIDEDLLSCHDLAEPAAELSQATVEPAVAEPLPAEPVVTPEPMIATQDDLADDKPRHIPVLVTTSMRDSERNRKRRRNNANWTVCLAGSAAKNF